MSEGSTLSLEKLTKVYLKITAKRTELKKAFDEEYGALTNERDRIKQALLEHCKEQTPERTHIVMLRDKLQKLLTS